MGIMDSVKSAVGSGTTSLKAVEAFTMLLSQSGGMQGLIRNFEEHGLGHIIQSWISSGPNLSIQPEQLKAVVGDENLSQVSQKVGMDSNDLLQKLAQYLPQAVDKLTPHGKAQDEQFSASSLLSLGKSLFH